eukprot:scaffold3115_cov234-Pinguiococcus_pyrenoidosus.AAC.1
MHALALAWWQLGRTDKAEQILRKVTKVHKYFVPGWVTLCRLLEQRGKIEGTRKVFEQAVNVYRKTTKPKKGYSSKSWGKWTPLFTARADFEFRRGGIAAGRKSVVEAIRLLKEKQALDARLVTSWALHEMKSGNKKIGAALYGKALELLQKPGS